MSLNLQGKQKVIFNITQVLGTALSAVVASLEGITANEISCLRSICRKERVYVHVIRNTLVCRAIKGSSVFSCLHQLFFGSNIIAFSTVESTDCIKIFFNYSKENKRFKIKGAVFDGEFFDESNIAVLSSLPSYNDSIMNLMFVMRESSIGKLIRLLYTLSRYKKEVEK